MSLNGSITFRMKGQRDRIISETSNINFQLGNLENVSTIDADLIQSNTIDATQVKQNGFILVPNGVIVMWSGVSAPDGWALCDGTNGTPDLRGRFILSAGSGAGLTSRTVGQTGGEETHTLTSGEMPAHTHTGTTSSNGSHSHAVNDPGHTHTQTTVNDDFNNSGGATPSFAADSAGSITWSNINPSTTGITLQSNGAHTHTFTTDSTGSSDAHNNMPPYYVLAYIMKL